MKVWAELINEKEDWSVLRKGDKVYIDGYYTDENHCLWAIVVQFDRQVIDTVPLNWLKPLSLSTVVFS